METEIEKCKVNVVVGRKTSSPIGAAGNKILFKSIARVVVINTIKILFSISYRIEKYSTLYFIKYND